MTRRSFLGSAAKSSMGFMIVPRHILGGIGQIPPSEKLNIAGVGIGGMGAVDLANLESQNIVALCDVDQDYAAKTFAKYPAAKRYVDFRKMLEEVKEIDAVVVATPDHLHAVVAMAAIRLGKHVYCEKPLSRTVWESRKLVEAAREHGVATQMGNHGHSSEGIRLVSEWIGAGAIGPVREVHAWTPLPTGIWPQGLTRPLDAPPVPATLNWDLWLGPAPDRPFHPAYHPFKWRGWWDFGTGAFGDQACHTVDVPFWALRLGSPTSIEASSTGGTEESYPLGSMVHFEFPARGEMPAARMTWYDGGLVPARPSELEPDRQMGNQYGGVLFIGDQGKLVCGTFGESPRLIPESSMKAFQPPAPTLPRSKGHYIDWIEACKGGGHAGSHFDYAGPLTELALLGNIAIKTRKKLLWDGATCRFSNVPEANDLLHREYRPGWSL